MRAVFTPSTLRGCMAAPPSKSMAHRLLIGASLCAGKSVLHNLPDAEDIVATVACLRALGATVERSGTDAIVHGVDLRMRTAAADLPCQESGSTLRFLIPLTWLSRLSLRLKERGALPLTPA